MPFVSIALEDVCREIDPFSLFRNGGAALVLGGGKRNALTLGWGSLGVLWRKPTLTLYVHATRYSKGLFDKATSFSYNVLLPEKRKALSYLGRVSGRTEDKIEGSGLTVVKDEVADYFLESSLVLLCTKMGETDFSLPDVDEGVKDWYEKDGVHTLYFGEIKKVLKRV